MSSTESHLQSWTARAQAAEEIVPLVGRLYRERGVVCTVYNINLVHRGPMAILHAHRTGSERAGKAIEAVDTLAVIRALGTLDLAPVRIDVGKLAARLAGGETSEALARRLADELAPVNTGRGRLRQEPQDVVLYGFGRIGRLLTRILIDRVGGGEKFRLRAVVVRGGGSDDLEKRANLLRRDSVHGPFGGIVDIDRAQNAFLINGNLVRLLYSDAPESLDYTAHGIRDAIVIDNTGKWRDREGLSRHLRAKGVSKVLLTAPGKGDLPNVVHGVNHSSVGADASIVSAASCTTNAIVPVLKAVNDRYGIVRGHVETIHSYTNDQNLIDNFHSKQRRGRGAPLNLVITETGAAKAVAKALPELAGRLTGSAIRVPTPNVSLAILNLELEREVTREELDDHLEGMATDSPLQNQIGFTSDPDVVSSDLVGDRHAGTVDGSATQVNGKSCVLYVWYDNEYGYSSQVMRLVQHLAGVTPPVFPRAGA